MGRRTRRQRRGGKAIGSGSDGCVFDGTFASDGTFTKTADTVTKVFVGANVPVAQQEYDMMKRVAVATGGTGVLVALTPPTSIATIPETAWENDQIKSFAACKTVVETPAGPFAGLVLPRALGTLSTLRNRGGLLLPDEAFNDASQAITNMAAANLAHLDVAHRNLFLRVNPDKTQTVLLGDFGSAIDVTDDAALQAFVAKYKIQGNFTVVMKSDGIQPAAIVLLVGYDALLRGKEAYEAYMKVLRDNRYAARAYDVAAKSWVGQELEKTLSDITTDTDAMVEFLEYLETQLQQVINALAGEGKTYETAMTSKAGLRSAVQRLLLSSDRSMFALVRLLTTKSAITASDLQALATVWFPKLVKPKQGGKRSKKRHTTRRVKKSAKR